MRIAPVALLASIALTSGCAALVATPVLGATVGAAFGLDRQRAGRDVSVTNHALVGAVVGFVIDAVAIAVIANQREVNDTPVARR